MLVILPFEKEFYRNGILMLNMSGHPLAEVVLDSAENDIDPLPGAIFLPK